MRAFLPIDPHLAFIRETHRLVLAWTCFEGTSVTPFTVTMTRQDLAGLRAALATASVCWESESRQLGATGDAATLRLDFRERGTGVARQRVLEGETLARFHEAVSTLAPGP